MTTLILSLAALATVPTIGIAIARLLDRRVTAWANATHQEGDAA